MRSVELDAILGAMLQSYDGISDLNFSVGRPLQVEAYGQLKPIAVDPPIDSLTAYQTENIALNILGNNRRLIGHLLDNGSCDCGYQLGTQARFRVNIFRQQGRISVVMRRLNSVIPSLDSLGLPDIFGTICKERTGLVLVTGATGSGKTTTLGRRTQRDQPYAGLPHRHARRPGGIRASPLPEHVLTSENSAPISILTRMGCAPRCAKPRRVILVGEMRDRETVEIAMTAAETGHLVLSTLHTIDAGQSINRILGLFEQGEEKLIRQRLSDTLRYVVSQRLAPKVNGGRQLIMEVMGNNLRTKEAIALGEEEGRTFSSIIEASEPFGWFSFDQNIVKSYESGQLDEDTAISFASNKGKVIPRG